MADASSAETPAKPESPIALPTDTRGLISAANDLIAQCRASSGIRAAYCRQLNAMTETGRQDGTRSIINKLHVHLERLASHLFSPTGLRFMTEYDWVYGENELNRGAVAARLLNREWAKTDRDIAFARAVFESLKYGACLFKLWAEDGATPDHATIKHNVVMPWQFGVMNESVNDLNRQPAMCETTLLTLPEVWKRIWRLPDAVNLFHKIAAHSSKGQTGDEYNSFYHQVLSTTTLNTGVQGLTRPIPGGIVTLNTNPNYAVLGPEVDVPLVRLHELWVWDGEDYTTIQLVEPDILIAPQFKKANLLVSGAHKTGLHPYTLIQPNESQGYLWGRSEIVDLIEPQGLLSTWSDDLKRLFGLQIDKILGFSGYDGLTDEVYDQRRAAGYFNAPIGSQVVDLTPQMPPNGIEMLKFCIQIIDQIGGFDNVLSGSGEPGVRSFDQMQGLMRVASPNLRDRSLLVERQCSKVANLNLTLKEFKDSRNYWTDGKDQETRKQTSFKLGDIPRDRQVVVDSHSSSPIFVDDHQQTVWAGVKAGVVFGEGVIDALPFPNKDKLKSDLRKRDENQQRMLQDLIKVNPEAAANVMTGKKSR